MIFDYFKTDQKVKKAKRYLDTIGLLIEDDPRMEDEFNVFITKYRIYVDAVHSKYQLLDFARFWGWNGK